MAVPAERFSATAAQAEQELLPLRLPAVLALAPARPSAADRAPAIAGGDPVRAPPGREDRTYDGGPVEFERVVPASGNVQVARRQFWLGPHRSGMTVTFWAGTDVIHVTIGGARVESLRSHLSATDLAALMGTDHLALAEQGRGWSS
jgi:hypothetical protein